MRVSSGVGIIQQNLSSANRWTEAGTRANAWFSEAMIRLSVVIAAKGRCEPGPMLEALQAQGVFARRDVDIHIAHDRPWPVLSIMPDARCYFHACPAGTSLLKLWGRAIAGSTAEFVAVLDIHCPPAPGWLARVLTQLETGGEIFFGPVEPGWASDDRRIVGYLSDYAQFKAPLTGAVSEIPGNNLVMRRMLMAPAPELQTQGFFKTFTLWRLRHEQGVLPIGDNDMQVVYRKPFALRSFLQRQYVHGRCFGATRHVQSGQPPRFLCLVFTPLLPWLRTWRIGRAAARDRSLTRAFRRYLLLVIWSQVVWSWGEFLGYTLGASDSCDRLD